MSASTSYGPGPFGYNSSLAITAATVIKADPGVLVSVSVVVAGSAAGAAYDTTTTTPANEFATIPEALTSQPLLFDWHCLRGIMIVPPTGGTVAVQFL